MSMIPSPIHRPCCHTHIAASPCRIGPIAIPHRLYTQPYRGLNCTLYRQYNTILKTCRTSEQGVSVDQSFKDTVPEYPEYTGTVYIQYPYALFSHDAPVRSHVTVGREFRVGLGV